MTAFVDELAPSALSYRWTLLDSYHAAKRVIEEGVPGDFVECGVYAGAQVAAMAHAIIETGDLSNRRIHLFDSFSGIPKAGPEDVEFLAAGHQDGLSACSLEKVQSNMVRWGVPLHLLVYHRGLFDMTVPRVAREFATSGSIALLRLDGDLYRSTKVCIEHFYPLLSKAGICIVDDYALSGARKAVDEFMTTSGYSYSPIQWRKP
jgi:O-methyltransferase